MATEDPHHQDAEPAGRKGHGGAGQQAGQASRGAGNAQGQKVAQQQGARGTVDQAPGDPDGVRRTGHAAHQLRQGNADTEETEG